MLTALQVLEGGDAPFTTEDFLNKLFPNFWSFLINILALIVLFVLLYFIAYKPVRRYLKARADKVEGEMKDAAKAKAFHEGKAKEADALVSKAREEASEIVDKAREDASREADRIVQDGKKEAAEKLKAADQEIASAVIKAREGLHDEIVSLAIDASKEALGKSLNPETEASLIASFEDDVKEK